MGIDFYETTLKPQETSARAHFVRRATFKDADALLMNAWRAEGCKMVQQVHFCEGATHRNWMIHGSYGRQYRIGIGGFLRRR